MVDPRPRAERFVNVHEAKSNLSKLLARAEAGEEAVIARNGTPIAVLKDWVAPRRSDFIGCLKHLGPLPDDFNDPDPELEALVYGDDVRQAEQ